MKTFKLKVIAAICGPLVVAGCAYFKPSPVSVALAPVSNIRPGDADTPVARAYQTGRDYEKAADAYRKAIKADPNNAEAHNALGVLYATQGKTDEAVTELMTAAALSPQAVHIQNNLGFAYLLTGRNQEAIGPLRIAASLDPANQRIRENLTNAQRRAGIQQPAPSPRDTLPDVVPPPQAKATPVDVDVDPNAPTLVSVAPNIFALRNNLPHVAREQSAPVARVSGAPVMVVKVEVSNGNGVAGLARRTSSLLQQRGYAIARLTNQLPYDQKATEIQYRRGQESEARRLNALLSVPTNVVESNQLGQAIAVRLILGRDVAAQSVFMDSAELHFVALRS